MFPFDRKEPRKPRLFGEFDRHFEGFDEYMSQMIQRAGRNPGQSYVWGFTSYTGPDGKTHTREYGNLPRNETQCNGPACNPQIPQDISPSEEPETPYHDTLDEGDKVKVIVDLPGLEKEDIELTSNGTNIHLKAENPERRYRADIRTPSEVGSEPEKAQYRNGVLEITYAKKGSKDIKVQ
ncbi:MAG: Hsp20 family protein [Candidatus Altiarchaeales archaeon]|nr:Hsp20 family protein [Candidatus Altiarchaeales archaeon]MBD3416601.1 Hsp20 family protein [Candidatus Altiarchaeales archaeon]